MAETHVLRTLFNNQSWKNVPLSVKDMLHQMIEKIVRIDQYNEHRKEKINERTIKIHDTVDKLKEKIKHSVAEARSQAVFLADKMHSSEILFIDNI